MNDYPPTLIVVHPKERKSKCTVQPLRGRPDFTFQKFPKTVDVATGYVQLGFSGPMLSSDDAACGLLILDGTWRLVEKMQPVYDHLPVRRLPGWKTAYPRISKLHDNPGTGLATIEAIYLAYKILGRDTTGLLDQYRWGEDFVSLNRELL